VGTLVISPSSCNVGILTYSC